LPDRTQPCNVAVVGAGYTAREHLRAFSDVPGVLIAGIHSRTRARAENLAREFDVPLVADSISELYERARAAVVVVAVNELSTNAVARACLEHPWVTMLEKPPGYDLADALDIRAAAGGRTVLVAMNRRAYGVTRAVQQALNETEGPRFVSVQDQQSQQRAAELGEPELVVRNYMYANSIHLIDYLRIFCRGQVEGVERVITWNPDCPGMVVATVRFSSGDIGLYEATWHAPGPWAVAVTVPGRRWELRPLEAATIQTFGSAPEPLPRDEWDHRFKPGYRAQAQAAVEFAAGRPAEVMTLDDAIETMRLIASIYKTAAR
jgi:predicted dehydrogenase